MTTRNHTRPCLQVHTLISDAGALHPLHGSLGWLARCGPTLRELTLSNYAQVETPQHWQAALGGLTGLRSLALGFPSQGTRRSCRNPCVEAWKDGSFAQQLPAVFSTLTALTSLALAEGPWPGLPPHVGALVNLKVSCRRLLGTCCPGC